MYCTKAFCSAMRYPSEMQFTVLAQAADPMFFPRCSVIIFVNLPLLLTKLFDDHYH